MIEEAPKKKLEKDIQREICDYLFDKQVFFWRSNNVPVFGMNNGGKRTFRSLPKHTPRGLPDIMMIIDGTFFGIEVKIPGGKIRPEQEVIAEKFRRNGAIYQIVYSVEDVKKIFHEL